MSALRGGTPLLLAPPSSPVAFWKVHPEPHSTRLLQPPLPWRQRSVSVATVEGGPGRQAESWRSRTGCVRSWLNRYWGTGERKQGSLIAGHPAADVEVGRGFHTRRGQSRSDGVTRDCPGLLAARCQSRPPLLQKSCPLDGFCQPRQPQVL